MKHDYKSDASYNAGLPDYTEAQIAEIYTKANVDIVTGLPVVESKSAGGKVALCAGSYSAGVLSVDAPMWAVFQAARKCGCPSCENQLANIASAASWHKSSPVGSENRRMAMRNVRYFIHRLTDIVFSPVIKHNV